MTESTNNKNTGNYFRSKIFCLRLQVYLFFIICSFADGFIYDAGCEAIPDEVTVAFDSAVACRHCCLLWFGDASVVFFDELGHVFGAAVAQF